MPFRFFLGHAVYGRLKNCNKANAIKVTWCLENKLANFPTKDLQVYILKAKNST